MTTEPYILEGGEFDGAEGMIREGQSDYDLRRSDWTMTTYRRTRRVKDGRRVYRLWSGMMPDDPDFETATENKASP
jgi:hypothetical protein